MSPIKKIPSQLIILLLAILMLKCEEQIEPDAFSIDMVISAVKCNEHSASFTEETIPFGSDLGDAYAFAQRKVVKGRDLLVSVTVPKEAEELYFSIDNLKADYLNLQFEEAPSEETAGHYFFKTENLPRRKTSETRELNRTSRNGQEYINYLVVLSTTENIAVDSYDLLISYMTPSGVSQITKIPIEVLTLAPFQKQLRVGFDVLTSHSYEFVINTPNGKKVSYSYNHITGNSHFDNSQSPESSLSHDNQLDVNWIDLDPIFGHYTLTARVEAEAEEGEIEYIEMLMIINAAGVIDQINPDIEFEQSGGNNFIGEFTLDFEYFAELSEILVENILTIVTSPYNATIKQEEFEGMRPHPFNFQRPGGEIPDKHLPIFFKDVFLEFDGFDSYRTEPIEVLIQASVIIPPDYTPDDLEESWKIKSAPIQLSEDSLLKIGFGQAIFKVPPKGGLYKIGYKPAPDVPESEVNILLPLASPELITFIYSDLEAADDFSNRVNSQYPNGFWGTESENSIDSFDFNHLMEWFWNSFHGDYIGRPDSITNLVTWHYNQVNDNNYRGIKATWFGIPVRLSDVSYFLVGYTWKKIRVPDALALAARLFAGEGGWNSFSTTEMFVAGEKLAQNKIGYADIRQIIIDKIYSKMRNDAKKYRGLLSLWPNDLTPTNYIGSYREVPDDFDPNIHFASPCFLAEDFNID